MHVWKGSFESTHYAVIRFRPVHGSITAVLPDDPTECAGCKASLTYRGLYRGGASATLTLLPLPGGGFAGSCGAQTVRFSPDSVGPDEIAGSYRSSVPRDAGTFVLRRQA